MDDAKQILARPDTGRRRSAPRPKRSNSSCNRAASTRVPVAAEVRRPAAEAAETPSIPRWRCWGSASTPRKCATRARQRRPSALRGGRFRRSSAPAWTNTSAGSKIGSPRKMPSEDRARDLLRNPSARFSDRLEEAGGRDVTLWRQWPSLIVLLCLGLMPAGDASCFAAGCLLPARALVRRPPRKRPSLSPLSRRPRTDRCLGRSSRPLAANTMNNRKRRVQPVEDQNIRNLEAQFRPQFQQLLYVELAFLRRVCKPDAKPFAEVAKAAKADLQRAAARIRLAVRGEAERTRRPECRRSALRDTKTADAARRSETRSRKGPTGTGRSATNGRRPANTPWS